MAGALRKTMEYLGLAETDEYDSRTRHDQQGEDLEGEWAAVDEVDDHGRDPQPVEDADDGDGAEARGPRERRTGYGRVVTPLHSRTTLVAAPAAQEPDDRSTLRRITTIHPRTYNEAKSIGESFRGGVPVIMNLTDMSDSDAKRLVDFSAGLVFGLRGTIERVTNKVFLLSPEHVTVTGEAPAVKPAHLFNQS